MKTVKKMASIQRLGDGIYLYPNSTTTAGVWIAHGPYARLGVADPAASKGEAALRALASSTQGIPHPTDWKLVGVELLKLAGVRSWRAFDRNANSVGLELNESNLCVLPYENRMADRRCHVPRHDLAIELPLDASAEQVGEAIERALELCGRADGEKTSNRG
jgi:hypothetical protein